jgi:hypothetical protein
MGDLLTGTDAKVYISSASVLTTTDTTTEFAALTWVEVGLVEKVGEYGDESAEITGNVISEGRTRRAKGVRNAGMQVITCFVDGGDAGQQAMVDAEATSNRYGIKIVPKDRLTSGGTDSISYYRGLVMSAKKGELSSDALQRITFNVGIDSPILTVPAT